MKVETRKKLVSSSYENWFSETVLHFTDGVKYTRTEIAGLLEMPSLHGVYRLQKTLDKFQIFTTNRLFKTGMNSLANISGVGERQLWVAALVLDRAGFDVEDWMDREKIKVAVKKGKKVRHPRE